MRVLVLEREQRVDAGLEETFAFFADARNLEAITPPWLGFAIATPGEIELRPGALIEYRLKLHGIRVRYPIRAGGAGQPGLRAPRPAADLRVSGGRGGS